MQLEIQKQPDSTVLILLKGRLNANGVLEVDDQLLGLAVDPETRLMVLDLSKVPMLGSVGIRLFLNCGKELEKRAGKLTLLNPTRPVREVLMVSGIYKLLPLVDSVEEAQALLT